MKVNLAERHHGTMYSTNGNDLKGGVATWIRSTAACRTTHLAREWSKYYIHTITRFGSAQVHNFNIYIPPDAKKADREHILRNLLFAMDKEVTQAQGENHVIVTGDFNVNGLKDMVVIAGHRGLSHIATCTRKGKELDAIFVSSGITVKSQTATTHTNSDHDFLIAQCEISVSSQWVDYAITVPISVAEKRQRLQNPDNRKLLESYEFKAGPFKDIAKMGHVTKREYVRFGHRPPVSYMPKGDFDPLSETRAASILNQKRQEIIILWKQGKMKKAWVRIRRVAGAQTASPPVEGLLDDNDVAQFADDKKAEMTLVHLKKTFQKQAAPKPEDFGRITKKAIFTAQEVSDAWSSCNVSKAIGPDDFDPKGLSAALKTRMVSQLTEMMNEFNIPSYLKKAKLMLLSKKSGACCKISDTRGIQILTFAFKVIDTVIYKRVMASGIFNTGNYQAGFKAGHSCKTDQTKLLDGLNREKRRKLKNRGITCLLDISAAFDCVIRPKLWQILDSRIDQARAKATLAFASQLELSQLDDMEVVITLLKELYREHAIVVGDQELPTHNGVMQGAVNSPWLFSIYLEHFLFSNEKVKSLCNDEEILAFADDLFLHAPSWSDLKGRLTALD